MGYLETAAKNAENASKAQKLDAMEAEQEKRRIGQAAYDQGSVDGSNGVMDALRNYAQQARSYMGGLADRAAEELGRSEYSSAPPQLRNSGFSVQELLEQKAAKEAAYLAERRAYEAAKNADLQKRRMQEQDLINAMNKRLGGDAY